MSVTNFFCSGVVLGVATMVVTPDRTETLVVMEVLTKPTLAGTHCTKAEHSQ